MERQTHRISLRTPSKQYSSGVQSTDIFHPQTRLTIEWSNIKIAAKKPAWGRNRTAERVELLHGICGRVEPGQMLAVIGPSGAGKSVLLRYLAGRPGKDCDCTGTVLVNGCAWEKEYSQLVAFVEPKTNCLDPLLTVKESLQFTCRLSVDDDVNEDGIEGRVQFYLTKMGLAEVADSVVGSVDVGCRGISNGERKRLCIAKALLREPKVLILDEPTSGLDSTSAKTLITQLRQLAIIDMITVIVAVHQPRAETIERFDNILLLAKGHQIYYGKLDGALGHFQKFGYYCDGRRDNPADFLLDVVEDEDQNGDDNDGSVYSAGSGHEKAIVISGKLQVLIDAWNCGRHPLEATQSPTPGKRPPKYPTTRWREFIVLFTRELIHFKRSGNRWATVLLGNILLGAFVGFIWFQIPDVGYQAVQNRIGLLAFVPRDRVIAIVVLLVVGQMRGTVGVERREGLYRASSIFLVIFAFYGIIEIAFQTLYAVIIYYIAGLKYVPFPAILIFLTLHTLLLTAILALFLPLPFLFADLKTAFVAGMVVWYLLALYNGLLVNLSQVSWVLRWPRYVSPEWYYFLGSLQNEFSGQVLDGQPGEYWLDLYALDTISIAWAAGALLIMNASLILASYATFRYMTSL